MSRETMEWLNRNTLIGFADNRGTAWHYRADLQAEEPNHYPGAIPVDDVLRRLFNFEVADETIYRRVEDGKGAVKTRYVEIPDRKAMVRVDTGDVFGLFKGGYRGHSYREWLVEKVSDILSDDLQIGSAGLLTKGSKAWVSVEMPETVKGPAGVDYRPHLLASTSFDGTLATSYRAVNQLVKCDNTLDIALAEGGPLFKARHSRYSGYRADEARKALALVESVSESFETEIKRLTAIKIGDREFDLFLDAIMPVPEEGANAKGITQMTNRRESLKAMYRNDPRCAPWSGTAFGVLQAVNTWEHHAAPARSKTIRPERNMLFALNGKRAESDQNVVKILAQIAN